MDVVHCPGCGEENPARFRMCGYCGTSLLLPAVSSVPCPACGAENPAGFRFCGYCATVLDGSAGADAAAAGAGGAGFGPGPGMTPPPWAWAYRWAAYPPPWPYPPSGYPPSAYPPPGSPQRGYAHGGYAPPGQQPTGYPTGGYPPSGYPAPFPSPGYPSHGYGPPAYGGPGHWPPAAPHAAPGPPAHPPAAYQPPAHAPGQPPGFRPSWYQPPGSSAPYLPGPAPAYPPNYPQPSVDPYAPPGLGGRIDPGLQPAPTTPQPASPTTPQPAPPTTTQPAPPATSGEEPASPQAAVPSAQPASPRAPEVDAPREAIAMPPPAAPADPRPPETAPLPEAPARGYAGADGAEAGYATAPAPLPPAARSALDGGHREPAPQAPGRPPPVPPVQSAPSPGASPAPAAPEAFPGFDTPEAIPRPSTPIPSSEVRKIVTIIFSDLKGSTALTEKIDAEAINEVKERYFSSMATEIVRHGGKIEKYIGDAIMAVFGLPRAHEDDALRAVRAAHGMTQALHRLNRDLLEFYGVEIAARTGVNTGEVVANSDPNAEQRLATGDAVNVAARLEQAAPANEVLIGEVTYDLVKAHVEVEQVEPLELKGKAERVPAYRLVDVRDATALVAQSTAAEAPLVGRDTQLELLRGGLRESASRGGARMATVLGEAGVGKSYLVDAFQREVRAATTVLRGRCLPYGDGITFWPLVEIVRAAASIVETDTPESAVGKISATLEGVSAGPEISERLASVAGLSTARFPVTEIFWGARKFLEALSTRRPVVVCLEDVHNAEETFLDLLEHLLETTAAQSAVLIVATGRLGLAEKRPGWASRSGISMIAMPALEGEDTSRLVEVLLDGPVDDVVKERVVASSEGNPLFVSQLVSMLVDKGLVHKHDDVWQASGDLATAAVPPTIQALLAARLDDLSREERAIMEPASVIGLAFPQPAIEELVPAGLRPAVAGHLRALSRKQFLDRDVSQTADDEIYRFRNLMIKDATYGSLLKRARATTHERFVTWAERVNRERGREQEFEEILGYHLEQAYRYRTELGPIDGEGRSIAARAAGKLGNAGRRAFARGDLPAASSLLRRAIAVLPAQDRSRIELEAELGEVLQEAGEFGDATTVLEAAIASAEAIGDAGLRARGRLGRIGVSLYAGEAEPGGAARAIEEATAAVGLFEQAGDEAGLARAYRVIGSLHATAGQYRAAAEAAQRVVVHATAAGDRRLASRSAAGYATIARAGDIPADEVVERCGPLLEQVQGDRKAEAVILGIIAVSEAMRGQFERARDLHHRARSILDELGRSVVSASTSIEGSRIEMLAGDHAAAEQLLQADADALETIGERYFRSTIVGLLAHALEAQAKSAPTVAAVELARELADEDDVESQILWRTALAKHRAREGMEAEAIALGQEALELAGETDDIDVQGDVHADYGVVLLRLRREDEARVEFAHARELYGQKGNLALERAMGAALGESGEVGEPV